MTSQCGKPCVCLLKGQEMALILYNKTLGLPPSVKRSRSCVSNEVRGSVTQMMGVSGSGFSGSGRTSQPLKCRAANWRIPRPNLLLGCLAVGCALYCCCQLLLICQFCPLFNQTDLKMTVHTYCLCVAPGLLQYVLYAKLISRETGYPRNRLRKDTNNFK